MRSLARLITQSRRSTENLDFSEDAGIQDDEFIQYFNDAQDELLGMIHNSFPSMYQKEKIYDVVANQEAYDIPDDCYIGQRIEMVEYSRSGLDTDYYILKKGDKRERISNSNGTPSFYIRRNGQILIQPKPEVGGKLRVLYQLAAPTLDTVRAVVSSVTLTGNEITSLVLDTTQNLDDTVLLADGFISIVDKNGEIQMKKIPISAINTTTGTVTVDAGFEFEDGETIAAGNYVVSGKNATTHSSLPDPFENYLLEYVNLRINIRDSSADSADLGPLLARIEEGIMRTLAEPDGDINLVPIIDSQYLSTGD